LPRSRHPEQHHPDPTHLEPTSNISNTVTLTVTGTAVAGTLTVTLSATGAAKFLDANGTPATAGSVTVTVL